MARKDYETETGDEKKAVTLEDFFIYDKVIAFARKYRPVKEQTFSTEVFNEERLREFFKAYVLSLGDPLKLYMQELSIKGFEMSVSITGEPAILVEEVF
jgi:hypothetical protein